MKLVVGLRNPGAEYEATRHNVGLEVLVAIGERSNARFKRGPLRVRCEFADVRVGPDRALLAAPISYMNEAGGPVRAALAYHKIDVGDMLVLHDDIDLAFGRLRLQVGGGTGGHNGLRSVEKSLGTRDFSRLKIGVGRPPGGQDPADFVLSRFTKAERAEVDVLIQDAADVVEIWLSDARKAQEMAAHRQSA